jgi:hypothetical protein
MKILSAIFKLLYDRMFVGPKTDGSTVLAERYMYSGRQLHASKSDLGVQAWVGPVTWNQACLAKPQ